MAKLLYNIACAMSLVLCGLLVALWLRGYWVLDDLKWRQPEVEFLIANSRGSIGVRVIVRSEPDPTWSRMLMRERTKPVSLLPDPRRGRQFLGFGYVLYSDATMSVTRYVVPIWFAVAVTAILPLHWAWLWRVMRRRWRLNLCLSCGYDLRASPDHCPECGSVSHRIRAEQAGR